MVSTFTPNVQLEQPARGDDVGTWDVPVNNNIGMIDLIAGGMATLTLNNSNVVLSAAQYECKTLTFQSTLQASVTITFPTSFKKSYEVFHTCTGSSAFTITLATTAAGGQVICLPPGEVIDVWNDGTNLRFKNMGRVGAYWDHAGSSVPNWVSGCTVPPYLNCDGTAFSSATYPQLATILGGTTLPDSKGRTRFALDQGAGRISSGTGGFAGSSAFSGGGAQTTTLNTSNLPPYTPSGTVTNTNGFGALFQTGGGVAIGGAGSGGGIQTVTQSFTGAAQGGQSQAFSRLPPAYIGGITMIRSA